MPLDGCSRLYMITRGKVSSAYLGGGLTVEFHRKGARKHYYRNTFFAGGLASVAIVAGYLTLVAGPAPKEYFPGIKTTNIKGCPHWAEPPIGYMASVSPSSHPTGGKLLTTISGPLHLSIFGADRTLAPNLVESQIKANGGVQAVGPVFQTPANHALSTCLADLSNNPLAHRLGIAALTALASHGMIPPSATSSGAIAGESTAMFVTSDPLDKTAALVTVSIPGPTSTPAPDMPGFRIGTARSYVAVVNIDSAVVTAIGASAW